MMSQFVITPFNFYYDVNFWIAFIFIILIYRLLSFNGLGRNIWLTLSSGLMILALPTCDLRSLIVICGLSLLVFMIGHVLNKDGLVKGELKRKVVVTCGVVIVVGFLLIVKYPMFQQLAWDIYVGGREKGEQYVGIIGISYLSFKMIHFMIESYKGQINNPKVIDILSYVLFFPAFISGPINRYNHFTEQLRQKKKSMRDDIRIGTERIINGLFKKWVLATSVFDYSIVNVQKPIFELDVCELMVGLYAHTLYFYFDFAGYSDLAIGCGRIMGIGLPENFNNPFLKPNIQQLWASWHMSLTGWLTDYVYRPLSLRLRRIECFRKRPVLVSNISIVVTFIVCGLWHGNSSNYLVWGIYHGFGLAVLNVYQRQKRKVRNRYLVGYFRSNYSKYFGMLLSFHFFVLGILLFSYDLETVLSLLAGIVAKIGY